MQGKINCHVRKWHVCENEWRVRCEATGKWYTPPRPYAEPFKCPHCGMMLPISATIDWYKRG